MSAFIVSQRTINIIVTTLNNEPFASSPLRKLREMGLDPQDSPGTLAQALYALNVEAVNHRYEEDTNAREASDQFVYEASTPHQALKSFNCFLYQCSEGNVPEKPLFKIIDNYRNDLMYSLVSQIPEYENAVWD